MHNINTISQEEDGHKFSNCLMNKRIYKKNHMKKIKWRKKNTPHENSKEKRDNPKRKNPQIYSIKLKIVCFSS